MSDFYDNGSVYYIIKVNGKVIEGSTGQRFTTREAAEQAKSNLPMNLQEAANIVPVTENGQQMLFE